MTVAYCSSLLFFYVIHHITLLTKAAKLLKMTVAYCSSLIDFYGNTILHLKLKQKNY
jgi:hypothetical protein